VARRSARLPVEIVFAGLGTLLVLAGQAFRFSSPFRDAVSGVSPEGISLIYPWSYILLAPFSGLADLWTFNSPLQHVAWGILLVSAYWAARPFGAWQKAILYYPAYILLLVSFLAWGALFPRPTARITFANRNLLAVDFHSHTSKSHDGRRFPPVYTPLRNIQWHDRQGYGAGFLTDHNLFTGVEEARKISASGGVYRSMAGEELSLHDAHIVSVGNSERIDNTKYTDGLEGLRRFLETSESSYNSLSILSLPEYWKHHWSRLEEIIQWGADGVELENSAPQALRFPDSSKKRVVELARKYNLFMVGVSDSHGWGSATYAWSIMNIPGHAKMTAPQLEAEILNVLKRDRFNAVRVLTRRKTSPVKPMELLVEPLSGLWTLFRTLTPALAVSWTAWIWLLAFLVWRRKANR
jgi:hypothetical protein